MNLKRILIFCTVCILGLLSFKVKVCASPNIIRYAGSNRYETSIEISKNNWTSSEYAIVVSGENFPDAICSSPISKKYDAPILLTPKNSIPDTVIEEIKRLKVKNVFIIGGNGAVSENAELQIKNLNIQCERIYGENRYETSIKVAQYIGNENGIIIASAKSFADVLSAAPSASELQMPILLTEKDYLPESIKEYIKDKKNSQFYVIGGTGVISDNVTSLFKNYKRLAGQNRYETNLKVINEFIDKVNLSNIYIATGKDFPDALSGSAAVAKDNSIIALTDNKSCYAQELIHNNLSNAVSLKVLGGSSRVSNNIIHKLFYGGNAKIFLGYASIYYPGDTSSYDSLTKNSFLLDEISTDTYSVDDNGSLIGQIPKTTLDFANKNGVLSFAMISNRFSPSIAEDVIKNSYARKALINNIMSKVKTSAYQGVNIDFENMYYYDRSYFTSFIRDLYYALHKNGYMLIVSVPAKTTDNLKDGWNGAFDYINLGKYSDYIQIMSYDEHYLNGTAGPIASLPWVKKVIDYSIGAIPKEKILLGLAAYGYDWSSNNTAGYSVSGSYNTASKYNAVIKLDEISKCPYYSYNDSNGIKHNVWFENSTSISYKLDLVNNYKLAGIAVWKLGLEDNAYMDMIKSKLER